MNRWQYIVAAVLFVVALPLPFLIHTDYTLQIVFRVFLFAALGLAWNLVGGYTGQLSLGHAAYFGVGAYGLALFAKIGLSPWLAVLCAVVVSMLSAAIIGFVSFRLRGPYFALCTIAFAEVVRLIVKNLPNVTGGDVGVQVPLLFPHSSVRSFYYAGLVLTIISLLITIAVVKSRFGYYLMAIREDEDTALSVGINTPRQKLIALLISSIVTAVGGALYASLFLYIVPDQVISMEISTEIAIVAMLGGAGTLIGPLVGSVILESAAEIFKNIFQEAHLLIYGALVIIVVLFLPDGIVGTMIQKLHWLGKAPEVPFAAKPLPGAAEEAQRVGAVSHK